MSLPNETVVWSFVDSLDYLLSDCRSGDPNRTLNCRINTALGALTGLVLPLFIVSGLLCNCLIAYINLWQQTVWTRQNVYISMVALADNCNIFMNGFMWMFLAKGLPWMSNGLAGFFHIDTSEVACKLVRYLESICMLTSLSLFLLMVMDRLLTLLFPFRFQRISGKSAMRACALVIFVCMVLAIPNAILYKWVYSDGTIVCYVEDDAGLPWKTTMYYYYNGLLFYPPSVPLILILLCNFFLIHQVRKIVRKSSHLLATDRTDKNSLVNTVICVTLSAVLLVSSSPVVISCFTEYIMSHVSDSLDDRFRFILWGIDDMGMTLIMMNEAVNWVFLVWKNREFRKRFFNILQRK